MSNRKPNTLDTALEHLVNITSLFYVLSLCAEMPPVSLTSEYVKMGPPCRLHSPLDWDRIEENKPQDHVVSQKPPEMGDIRRYRRIIELPEAELLSAKSVGTLFPTTA